MKVVIKKTFKIKANYNHNLPTNKLETFEDALFESSKTSTHKTEKLTH